MIGVEQWLPAIRRLHAQIRDAVLAACQAAEGEAMARVAGEEAGDTIYAVDRVSEAVLVDFFAREVAPRAPLVLVAEGLEGGRMVLPEGCAEEEAVWRVIVDPIDGTRGLMYQKRSGWVLTGVAPNRGPRTGLGDIEVAVQTEIPLLKQHLMDQLWAVRDRGAWGERCDRVGGGRRDLHLQPSQARSVAHGFFTFARFFPGQAGALAEVEAEVVRRVLGEEPPGRALCFEDQYISSGGQLYELMAGRDRCVVDLRPLSGRRGLCCHPYDLCAELIARELGVVVTGVGGERLDAPLEVEPDLCWIGYANAAIRAQVEAPLQAALARCGLL